MLKYLAAICLAIIMLVFPYTFINAEEDQKKEIDLSLNPTESLFQIPNMSPGDTFEGNLIIINNGKRHFHYTMAANLEEGSKKLFETLMLELYAKDTLLYKGKLNNLTNLDKRLLATNNQETLRYVVHFPINSGNDFQRLKTIVKFQFSAEEKIKNIDGTPSKTPGSGFRTLPSTATGIFNLLLIGSMLIVIGTALYVYKQKAQKY
jgi:hypothetical protein